MLLLDNNLLQYLPPCLALVRKLEVVSWPGNSITFPPREILDQGWKTVKPFLHQFCLHSRKTEPGNEKIIRKYLRKKRKNCQKSQRSSSCEDITAGTFAEMRSMRRLAQGPSRGPYLCNTTTTCKITQKPSKNPDFGK